VWCKIYDCLEENGLNPYPLGKHKGECKENFCIIKEGEQIPNIRSNKIGQQIVEIIVYVPYESYLNLRLYVKEIKNVLKELKFLRKTGNETSVIVDDDKKAYTMSIEYILLKKLEG
jgi:hypothetical protein